MTFSSPASVERTPTQSRALSVEPDDLRIESSAVDYRPSHSVLLTDLYGAGRPESPPPQNDPGSTTIRLGDRDPGTGRRLGGIVVPTCRPFSRTGRGLGFAAELALEHGCPLIVVHSRDARAEEFPAGLRADLGDALVLIDLDQVDDSWFPKLATARDELGSLHRSNDVGRKRNLGIMLAVRLGWQFVLFLDDDISAFGQAGATVEIPEPDAPAPKPTAEPTLDTRHLAHALRSMREDEDLRVVGWPLAGFCDNSVVGHARRGLGLPQDIFISSGALLLRVTEEVSFFPEGIYNEDWMLLIQTLAGAPDYQRALARGGPVEQQPYPVFLPERARSEEAGEILGEGLMNLVEDHGPGFPSLMSGRYWKRVKAGRRALLHRIIRGRTGGELLLWQEGEAPLSSDPVVVCMNTALWTHRELSPRKLATYSRNWWDDRDRWRSLLVSLSSSAPADEPDTAVPDLLTRPGAVPGQVRTDQGSVTSCQGLPPRSASTTDGGREITD